MNVDDERLADYYREDGYSRTDYRQMSKTRKQKDDYIRKEQMNRKITMTQEQGSKSYSNLYAAYPQERVQTLSMQSTVTDNEFTERDWTPQDSSYGAAFPWCGWVPKSKRQLIEKIMIALAGLFVIWLITTIAMLLTSSDKKNGSSSYGDDDSLQLDDDFYVKDQQWYGDDNDDYMN